MAKAGKKRQKAGAVAAAVNGCGRMVREFAPSLLLVRATLYPFEDLISSECAGPQPNAKDYDPDEEPWFEIMAPNPAGGESWVHFRFNARGVVGQIEYRDCDGEAFFDEPYDMTLESVHDYLRQLPRPPFAFARSV